MSLRAKMFLRKPPLTSKVHFDYFDRFIAHILRVNGKRWVGLQKHFNLNPVISNVDLTAFFSSKKDRECSFQPIDLKISDNIEKQ